MHLPLFFSAFVLSLVIWSKADGNGYARFLCKKGNVGRSRLSDEEPCCRTRKASFCCVYQWHEEQSAFYKALVENFVAN